MGGRGTFGTKQNKLNRDDIIKALVKQAIVIALDGKQLTSENLTKLNNNDLSILKDFIGRPDAKNISINLTSNFSTQDVGKPIKQVTKLRKDGKSKMNIVQVNRSIYKNRGIKYFNKVMESNGYAKGIKGFTIEPTKKSITKKPKVKKPKLTEEEAIAKLLKVFDK